MSAKPQRKIWHIQGWDSTELLFEQRVPFGQITEASMNHLLRALVAKIALTEAEIVASYAKKRTALRANHLEVSRDSGPPIMLSCGDDPFVTAVVRNTQ